MNRKIWILLIVLILLKTSSNAQTITQTVKGIVVEKSTQKPIPLAFISIENNSNQKNTLTNDQGEFELTEIPLGRYKVSTSVNGFLTESIEEIILGSSKEVTLIFELIENITELQEVKITSSSKNKALNSMATISARSFNIEETRRYAGGMDDPARLATAFAGVSTSGNMQNNAIVIRGNSPRGLLWRVEGVEVTNPNHFSDGNVIGGGLMSALSCQTLSKSDFYTGAFPADYGNALAGVFDLKLRKGNSDKREHTVQVGLLGIDLATEGPFKKGKEASYLFNYRYSTLGALSKLGIIPKDKIAYQDLSFKTHLPTQKSGIFTLWGFGGIDQNITNAKTDSLQWKYESERFDNTWNEKYGAFGIANKIDIGNNSYLNTSIVYSGNFKQLQMKRLNDSLELQNDLATVNNQSKITLSSFYNYKFNKRHTNRTGLTINELLYDLNFSSTHNNIGNTYKNFIDQRGNTSHIQFFTESKYFINQNWWFVVGLQSEYFKLNNNFTVDPRLAMNWNLPHNQSIGIGYGKHSQLEKLNIYFIQDSKGNYPNKNLQFSHAHHFVMNYEWRINNSKRLKIEPYYQYLYNIPGIANSSFSMINLEQELAFQSVLGNNSTGKNYGVDLTFEQFLTKNYYYLVTASLFDSSYKGDDQIWRNTRFNKNVVFNILIGKEFNIRQNNLLGINLRGTIAGGQFYSPLNQSLANSLKYQIFDETKTNSLREPISSYVDVSLTYKVNKKKYSGTWALQVKNILGNPQHNTYEYNRGINQLELTKKVFVVPSLSYKLEF